MTLFKDCAKCKRLMKEGNCRGTATWWPMRELWLCRVQMMFLIENLGAYPPNPYVSGYTEAPQTSHRIKANAPFEAEASLWAELTSRLDRTGTDGKWLISDVQKGVTLGELAYEPRCALHYCSGWARKRIPYKEWKWLQENRRKSNKILRISK